MSNGWAIVINKNGVIAHVWGKFSCVQPWIAAAYKSLSTLLSFTSFFQKKDLQKRVCSNKYLFKFMMWDQQGMTSSILILTLHCSVNTWSNSIVLSNHWAPNLHTYVWFVYMHSDLVTKMVLKEILRQISSFHCQSEVPLICIYSQKWSCICS